LAGIAALVEHHAQNHRDGPRPVGAWNVHRQPFDRGFAGQSGRGASPWLLYKGRWKVELFFKWIKQRLRIKHFYGASDNAVKTQIWISICVYVLVAIVKKQIESEKSLHSILQILSVNAFGQEPLHQMLRDSPSQISGDGCCNQLVFNY
jgi:hypothetical protein